MPGPSGLMQPGHATAQVITADAAPKAPGKSTRTQKLPPTTGVPLVDSGTLCDRQPDDEGCLDPQRRAYAVTVVSHAVGEAMACFRDSIQDKRIALITVKPEGPGIIIEGLIEGLTGPLVGLGVKSAGRFLRAAAGQLFAHDANRLALALTRLSFSEEKLKTVVGFAAKKLGGEIKGLFTSDGGNAHKAEALKLLRAGIPRFSNNLIMNGLTDLDDVEITALGLGYADQEFHSVAAYTEHVELWLNRYDANGIAKVGEETHTTRRVGISSQSDSFEAYDYSHGELAWVTLSTGDFRLALLKGPTGKEQFERLIDRDFESAALTVYAARTGYPPTRKYTLTRDEETQACTLADRSWMNGLVGCSPGGSP